jgi:hypothetical protein
MKAHAPLILMLRNILLLILYFGTPTLAKPGDSQGLGDTVSQAGLFSYQAPKGWSVKSSPLSKYEVAFDVPRNNFVANINVVVESFPESLAKYVSLNKQYVTASGVYTVFQVADERPFETSTGAIGVRLVAKDQLNKRDMQQIFYFFEGSSNNKFVVTASCLAGDGDQYAPVFDASVKTFSPQ